MGGDDLYRVRVLAEAFGAAENLGAAVNTPRNEWAPMLSPDGRTLLFSSDGYGHARMDLITSRVVDSRFTAAVPLRGDINTPQDEFDATFLADGRTVIFTRAANLATDRVRLFHSSPRRGRYGVGAELSEVINTPGSDTYAPMLDWSRRGSLTFTTRRPANSADGADLHVAPFHMW
jgi:Tol biopolymer transport system component